MNILVLGSGGREHAIAWALQKSPKTDVLYVAPGNGGTAEIAENVDLDIADSEALLSFVAERKIGLVVIGPEAPLVDGVADVLRAAGVPVFGPNADGAQLEGSKAYSKEFMMANTQWRTVEMYCDLAHIDVPEEGEQAVRELPLRVIVPAFMTQELQEAFYIGFLLYIPFLLIDVVVSSTLMSMGMIMLPPSMISTPFKLLLFVSVNGWQVLFSTLVQSVN